MKPKAFVSSIVYLKATPLMENILPSIEGEFLPICMQNLLPMFYFLCSFILFYFQFYDVGKVTSHNHPKENLAKFGYKTYMEKKFILFFSINFLMLLEW
jgi:hypothetical protein